MIYERTFFIKLFIVLLVMMNIGCQGTEHSATFSIEEDTRKVMEILKVIDNDISDTSIYADDVVHMAQGSRAITNKAELSKVLQSEATYGKSIMQHELVSLHSYEDMVLTRGRVTGTWYSSDGASALPFETNNMITFRRMQDGSLKAWQVIFNRVNLENY